MTVMNWILSVLMLCFWKIGKRKQNNLHRAQSNNGGEALTAKVFLSIFRIDSLLNFSSIFQRILFESAYQLLNFGNESSSFCSFGLLETFGRNSHKVDKVDHQIFFFFFLSILSCTCIKFFAFRLDENGKIVWKLIELISWSEWSISGGQGIVFHLGSKVLLFGSHSWASTKLQKSVRSLKWQK